MITPNPQRPIFSRLPAWWPEAAVLLLAAITRFWRLGYHSIWFDEAVSLKWAAADASYTWQVTLELVQEKHPPIYFLFLHYWQGMLSLVDRAQDDLWLRASGSILGILTVAGLMLLAGRLSGRRVALASGLLAALAPALVWYSQELRMFQPATTALVWAALFLLMAWQTPKGLPRAGLWLAMIVAFLAALYSYLFSALMLPAAGLSLLLLWFAERRRAVRRLVEGIIAFALTGLLFLPLAQTAWEVNGAENTGGALFAGLPSTLDRLLRTWTIWRPDWPSGLELGLLGLFGFFLIAGLLLRGSRAVPAEEGAASHQPSWLAQGWLALWVGVPILVGNLMLAGNDSVFAEDRYFLFVAPFALWAVARGAILVGDQVALRIGAQAPAAWLRTGIGFAPVGVAALLLLLALPILWSPARYREQWRAASEWIEQQVDASPGLRSTVITHVDYTHLPAEWYLRQRFTFDELPLFHPFGGTLTPEMMESAIIPPLQGVEKEGYDTLFLLQSHLEGVDDGRLVGGWLAENYPLHAELFPAGIQLTAYTIRSRFDALPPLTPDAVTPNATLAPGIRLSACEVTMPVASANNPALHPGPGIATVRLWWQRDLESVGEGDVTSNPQPQALATWHSRVRMINEQGVWGEQAQRPGGLWERLPPATWNVGEYVREDVAIQMNPQAEAGPYRVEVRLVESSGSESPGSVDCGSVMLE